METIFIQISSLTEYCLREHCCRCEIYNIQLRRNIWCALGGICFVEFYLTNNYIRYLLLG